MTKIVDLKGDGTAREGRSIDPDQVLEKAVGQFDLVVVLGLNKDGEVDIRGSHGEQETVYWMERAKAVLLAGRDGRYDTGHGQS
jgi:hypothetical protein